MALAEGKAMSIETIRFRNDTATRKRLMVPESFAHPAKGALGMWALMIERYSQPGDTVLDPMAGSGATLLAALMGRSVIALELEQHFVEPMRRSWEKMKQNPMLGSTLGTVTIIRGDARALPLPDASVGSAITSPPFEDQEPMVDTAWFEQHREEFGGGGITAHYTRPSAIITSPPYQVEAPGLPSGTGMGAVIGQHGTGYTRPSAIITSPPYEGSEVAQSSNSEANRRFKAGEYTGDALKGMGLSKGYTRPVDAVVSSPPYEGVADVSKNTNTNDGLRGHPETENRPMAYGRGGNIGNLRSTAYWDSMRQVYAECHRVLRPGGIMALVLKGFTRDGQYIDLPQQTADLVESLGFVKFDEWRRELWSLSFWRILQQRRDPAAWDERLGYESVLAFKKPEGQGK